MNSQNSNLIENNNQSQSTNSDTLIQKTVANIFGQMKALEGKYIDLANFYKHELTQSSNSNLLKNHSTADILEGPTSLSQNSQNIHHVSHPSTSSSKSAVSGVISIQQRDIQAQNINTASLMQQNSTQGIYEQAPGSIHQNSGLVGSTFPQQQHAQEDLIISDLKKEQKKLEQKMQQFMQAQNLGKGAENTLILDQNDKFDLSLQGQSIQQKCVTLHDNELIRFNNELQGVFKDILDHVDHSQLLTVNTMGQKQTEMFQLSIKYRLPSGFKNDAIGVWYDAKTEVIQYISKLKQFIQEKGSSLLAQAFKPSQALANLSQDTQKIKQDYFKLIETFEEDMVNLKRKSKDFNKSVQKLRIAIKTHDDSINQDKSILKNVFSELSDAIFNTNDFILGKINVNDNQNYSDFNGISSQGINDLQANLNSLTMNSQGSANIQMSPFDKRVNAYQKNAFNRSNSRGISTGSGGIQKPPKLAPQPYSQTHKPNSNANGSKNLMNEQQEWHPNIRVVKQRAIDYQQTVNQLLSEVNEKHEKVEEIVKRVDEQINVCLMKFLTTHDTDIVKQFFTNTVLTPTETAHILAKANLQAHQQSQISGAVKNYQQIVSSNAKKTPKQSVSPYRQSRKSASREPSNGNAPQFRKTTPTRQKNPHSGVTTSASRAGGNISSHGQTPSRDFGNFKQSNSIVQENFKANNSNQDQIFKELKKSNDKCMEYQIEIRKLKDQVQVYNLQLEDLRIHNNRYQIQIQNYQKQINQFRINNTRTARVTPGNLSVQEIQSPSHRLYGEGMNQIGQAYSLTSYSQDKEEILAEEQELCKRIDLFFQAMKLLQKAVNRKEDISELKVEFETKQRALQKLSKQIQVRINGSKMQSQHNNQDQTKASIQENSENLNKKGNIQNTRNRSQSTRGQQTSATRPQVPASSSHRLPSSPLRSKQNALNQQMFRNSQKAQAGPPSNSGKSPKPFRGTDQMNQMENRQQNQNDQQNIIYDEIFIQENQSVNIIQSKTFANQNNTNVQSKSNTNQPDQSQQLFQAKKQIQELTQYLNSVNAQKNELLSLVQGHQKSIFQVQSKFNQGKSNLSQPQLDYINEVFTTLLKELDVTVKHVNSKGSQNEQLNSLKDNLVQKISQFESQLIHQYNQLNGRLMQREEELQHVKKLFIDKLKVLESNFSEIGDHLIANQVQKELEAQNLVNQEPESQKLLKKYLADSDHQELDEKQFEELINTNSQLHDQINQLKKEYQDYVGPQQYQQVLQNLKSTEERLQKLETEGGIKLQKAFDNLKKEKNLLQEELQKQKNEKINLQQELQRNLQQQMNQKLEQEKKDMNIEQKINEIQLSLKDEIEQKICAQKEAKEKSQIAKQKESIATEKELQLNEKDKFLIILEDENEAIKIQLHEEIQKSKKQKNKFDEELQELDNNYKEAIKLKQDLQEEYDGFKNISENHMKELEDQLQEMRYQAEVQRIKLIQEMEIEKVESSKKWNLLQQKLQVIEEQKSKEQEQLQKEIQIKADTAQKIESEMEILKQYKQQNDELLAQIEELQKYQIENDDLKLKIQEFQNLQNNEILQITMELQNSKLEKDELKIQIEKIQKQNQDELLAQIEELQKLQLENDDLKSKIQEFENQQNDDLLSKDEELQKLILNNDELKTQIQKLEQQQNEELQVKVEELEKYQQNIDELQLQIGELKDQNIDLKNQQNENYNQLQEQIEQIDQLKSEKDQQQLVNTFKIEDLQLKIENKIFEIDSITKDYESQIQTLEENNTLSNQYKQKLEESILQLKSEKDLQSNNISEQLEQQNMQLQEQAETLSKQIDEQQSRILDLEQVIEENIASMDNYKQQIVAFEEQHTLLQTNLENIQSNFQNEIDECLQSKKNLETQYKDLLEQNSQNQLIHQQELKKEKDLQIEIQTELEIKIKAQVELQAQNDDLKIEIEELSNQLQNAQNENIGDQQQQIDFNNSIQTENQQLKKQIQQLNEQISNIQSGFENQKLEYESTVVALEAQIEKMIEDYKNQQELFEQQIEIEKQQTLQNYVQEMKIKTDLLSEKEDKLQQLQKESNILNEQLSEQQNQIQIQNQQCQSQIETISKLEEEILALKQQNKDVQSDSQNINEYETVIQQLQQKIQDQNEEFESRKEELQNEIIQLKEDQKRVDELLDDLDELQKNQDDEKNENEKLKQDCQAQLLQISQLNSQLQQFKKESEEKEEMISQQKEQSELDKQAAHKVKTEQDTEIVKLKLEAQIIKNDLERKLRLQRDATAELINDLETKAKMKEEQLEQLAHQMFGQKPLLSNRSTGGKNNTEVAELEQERQNMIQVMQDLRLQLEKERSESQKLKEQLKDKEQMKMSSSRR